MQERKAKRKASLIPTQVPGLPNYYPVVVDDLVTTERKLNMLRHGDVDRDQRAALVKETLPARRSEILGGPEKKTRISQASRKGSRSCLVQRRYVNSSANQH